MKRNTGLTWVKHYALKVNLGYCSTIFAKKHH